MFPLVHRKSKVKQCVSAPLIFSFVTKMKYPNKNNLRDHLFALQFQILVHHRKEIKAGTQTANCIKEKEYAENFYPPELLACSQQTLFSLILFRNPCLDNRSGHNGLAIPILIKLSIIPYTADHN